MYLFITYARESMKGVQARGIRVANELKENSDVLFWNDGDCSWLEKEGLPFEKIDFKQFSSSSSISFPNKVKAVIFADLPTNRPLQTAILIAARNKKIPTVVLENQYRKNQEVEGVYEATRKYCDLMVFNGLSYLQTSQVEGLKYVPPLLPPKLEKDYSKKSLENRIGRTLKDHLIICVGYNKNVLEVVEGIANALSDSEDTDIVIVGSPADDTDSKKNVITVGRQDEKGMVELFSSADLILAKPGFLQVQEALAYGIPIVTLGEDAGFRREWIDQKTIEVVKHYPEFSTELIHLINSMRENNSFWQEWKDRISTLHNGEMDGAKKIAKLVGNISFKEKNLSKSILVCLDKKEEREAAKEIIAKNDFILPIYLSAGFFTGEKNNCLDDFRAYEEGAILQQTSELIFDFGWDSVHGFSKIFPMYDALINLLKSLISQAEVIYVVGEETKSYIAKLIDEVGSKAKIHVFDRGDFIVNKRQK